MNFRYLELCVNNREKPLIAKRQKQAESTVASSVCPEGVTPTAQHHLHHHNTGLLDIRIFCLHVHLFFNKIRNQKKAGCT